MEVLLPQVLHHGLPWWLSVNRLPVQETWVPSLGGEDALE